MRLAGRKMSSQSEQHKAIVQQEPTYKKQAQNNALERFLKNRKMIDVLLKKGIKTFFPVQFETYAFIYDKKDLIAKDRTGSGKTLAFSLPIIERFRDKNQFGDHSTKFLIVLPTRELANQVKTEINSLKLSKDEFDVVPVYGGTNIGQQIDEIKRGADIIVSTPGRLLDMLERGVIKLDKLQVVCLDEADQMLRQGFQQDIEKIFRFIKKFRTEKTQNLLFSATVPAWVVQLSKTYLSEDRQFIDLIKDSAIKTSKTIEHLSIQCHSKYERDAALAKVIDFYSGKNSRTIIFTQTKRQANEIGQKAKLQHSYEVLHGDIPQKKREFVFKNFKEGKLKCIIATNVAARGLDIPEVELVIQTEPPKDTETYIHRAGRTGRAGKSGVCLTFYTDDQKRLIYKIQELAQIKVKDVPIPEEKKPEQQNDKKPKYARTNDVAAVSTASVTPARQQGENEDSLTVTGLQYIRCMLKLKNDFISMAPVFEFLQQYLDPKTYEQVQNMRRSSENAATFDVPQHKKDEIKKVSKQLKEDPLPKYELSIVQENIKIVGPNVQDTPPKNPFNSNPQTQLREAQRRRKQLEVFVGGLSYSLTEQDLSNFFAEKNVRTVKAHILKDSKGDSKGVAFVLCADDRSVREALKLNGESLHNRTLRINKDKC